MLDMHIHIMHIRAMKLTDYMEMTGANEEAIAEKIGASQSYVNRLKNGHVWPSREMAQRIATATDGAVTPNDFIEIADTVKDRRSA